MAGEHLTQHLTSVIVLVLEQQTKIGRFGIFPIRLARVRPASRNVPLWSGVKRSLIRRLSLWRAVAPLTPGRAVMDEEDRTLASENGPPAASKPKRRQWTSAQVETEFVRWVIEHGRYPRRDELRRAGEAGLESARQRLFHGRHDELHAIVEHRVGRRLRRGREPSGMFDDESTVMLLLRPLCETLGHFPSRRQIETELSNGVYRAVLRLGGSRKVAELMQCRPLAHSRLTREAALDLFRRKLMGNVTISSVQRIMGAAGVSLLYRNWNGIGALRSELEQIPFIPARSRTR